MENFDCVVVGAGWYGLAAAQQFHYTQPDRSLAIFDSHLRSNNLLGTFEYLGFPMTSDRFDVKPDDHIKGATIHSYLKAYAEHSRIADLIRPNHTVVSAEHQVTSQGGWVLTIATPSKGEVKVFARQLILATGLTSRAFVPHFFGQEDLATANAVAIFGARKFTWDAVHAYATAGVKVHWVPHATPTKIRTETLANTYTRLVSWFSPCIWGNVHGYGFIRRFLHATAVDTAKLKPWTDAMFTGASLSILNYEQDIYSLVKSGLVNVCIDEIDHLSAGKVHLASGTVLSSDVLVAYTGWNHVPNVKLLPEGIEVELGAPYSPADYSPAQLADQQALVEKADEGKSLGRDENEILLQFPRLKRQPVWNANYKPMTEQKGISSRAEVTPCTPQTPYMLHRFLVPASPQFLRTRDIAFAVMLSNTSNAITAHISGLWISAFFAGKLGRESSTLSSSPDASRGRTLQYETVLYNRWGMWRYPTDWGNKRLDWVFDNVPYFDLLQKDLGLNPHRKGVWFAEITQGYGPKDYRGIEDEWM
ncbi:hypothetical protein F4678DRAFT_475142 [Xylaria arbuscula]|nr:hypothetical protein F4678DRAFT_475142 [Xylaria arbuscula]